MKAMKRLRTRGLSSVGAMVALFAAFGGFGCLCSVGGRRCGGDIDDPIAIGSPPEAGVAADAGENVVAPQDAADATNDAAGDAASDDAGDAAAD